MQWTFLCDFFHNRNNHTASFLLETSNTSDVTLSWYNNFFSCSSDKNTKCLFFLPLDMYLDQNNWFSTNQQQTHLPSTSDFITKWKIICCILSKSFPRNGSMWDMTEASWQYSQKMKAFPQLNYLPLQF